MTIAPVGTAPPAAAAARAPRARFAAVLEARAGPGALPGAKRTHLAPAPSPAAAPPGPTGPWLPVLARVERAQASLDRVLAQARAGRTFTAAELLAVQAEAYRCAQVVDLGAKLAEQGAQSLRQALNTQV